MDKHLIAEVIVEVPSAQTDRAFSYLIPKEYEDDAKVGSRVRVPFRNRYVQGYIIQIKTDSFPRKLKQMAEVMDFTPSLTPELILLGQYMADAYLCHTITAFQSMVPAVLKGKTRKIIRLHSDFVEFPQSGELFKQLIKGDRVDWDEAVKTMRINPRVLRKWVEEKKIVVEETVKDRVTVKKTTWVWASYSPEEIVPLLRNIPKSAIQQKRVLQFFATCEGKTPLPHLLSELQTTRAVIKKLIEKGWLHWEEREEYRDPFANRKFKQTTPLTLTKEQASVFSQIMHPIQYKNFHSFLLQGVTGSGKTEVYLQVIERVLHLGREAIVLVPEISLTPQMVERFKGRFGAQVAVLHSRLSNGERYDEWRKIRDGKVRVAIGARSAIFAPFQKLGLIIIDEEHESSYKQEDNPKYDAREIAVWRAKQHDAVLVLGTATPSLDSYYAAQRGKHTWIQLNERVHNRPFPEVRVVDMRNELKMGNRSIFSESLHQALKECLGKGEQAVVFLNRRGYATFVMCRVCGEVIKCPHCDISLTFHQSNDTLRCHYCGHASKVPRHCPTCQSDHIRHFGTGTQKVEHELLRQFPGMKVIRMDVDTTSRKGDHEKLLSSFAEGRADVLLGTQMIAKGLDFPNVTLVGVIAADTMLHLPDYRAAERTFQLLVQVSGRAGRHDKSGKVIIQTYSIDHYSIEKASKYQVESFYHQECILRKRNFYPPYCGLYTLLLTHQDRNILMRIGQEMAQYLRNGAVSGYEVLGPVPPSIPRIKDCYRLQIVIKVHHHYQQLNQLKDRLRELQKKAIDNKIRLSISRDSVREE